MRRSTRTKPKTPKYNKDSEEDDGDFVDSDSDATIPENESNESEPSSGDEFINSNTSITSKKTNKKKLNIVDPPKRIFKKIRLPPMQNNVDSDTSFTVKDLTEFEKKLPDFSLNLSESDSDDDCHQPSCSKTQIKIEDKPKLEPSNLMSNSCKLENITLEKNIIKLEPADSVGNLSDSNSDDEFESTINDNIIPGKLNFQRLHESSVKLEEAKKSLEIYNKRCSSSNETTFGVQDLLAMGESEEMNVKNENNQEMSDSDIEDLEEVKGESKNQTIAPKGGITLTLDLPNGKSKEKNKLLDIEMMMKRRINRVKKEYQLYMHKVHVLSWIAHGNYVNKILNHDTIMAKALSLIPSEHCYPESRVNIKYLEQIAKWYSETVDVKEDKDENKYKRNKLALNILLLNQISLKRTTSKKNKVLIFISMLRALGIKCRLILSFRVVPLHPPASELCSLATKKIKDTKETIKTATKPIKPNKVRISVKSNIKNISQLDGADDDIINKRKCSKKKSEIIKKKPSVKNDTRSKVEEQPSTSTVSYWDTITKDVIDEKPAKRISHRELSKKRSEPENKSKFFNKEDKKIAEKNNTTTISRSIKSNSKNTTVGKMKMVSEPSKPAVKPVNDIKSKRCKKSDEHESSKYFSNAEITPSSSKIVKTIKKSLQVPAISNSKSESKTKKGELKIKDQKNGKKPSIKDRRSSNNSEDADFKPVNRRVKNKNTEAIDRRVLSSDDETSVNEKKKSGVDIWCEVYVEEEEQWISVDVIKGEVHCVHQIYTRSSHPVTYIVGWDTSGYTKDVTRRYVPHWNTITRRLRVNPEWYTEALLPWMAPFDLRDKNEDEQLDRMQLDAPMPQTIFEFKNHPLYALKRHLLKFEVIYPPNAMVLGFVKNEPVYARECVHTCRSRETWVKEAKVVKPGEEPYKIVKARPKYDRSSGKMITDLPLEVFGPWQTQDYVPPRAENGVVPRNPYGNVELFKDCMLPGGTVHLVLPGLNKVARKLQIDCAPAMVGFDYHSGGCHPLYDGFVVCEEFKDQIIAAWEQEQIEAELRAKDKIERRVYGNWKRLIRGLFIRERLQMKYDFKPQEDPEASGSKSKKRPKDEERLTKKQKITHRKSESD